MDRAALQERFGIVGSSQALMQVLDRVRQVARTDITVLVEGESGVGKELIAHAVHELSPRKHGPFIIVNCGAIPEGLIESELFGAEKGAYTGATERRTGYFEGADKGTIFLDEIGEMPLAAQVRLLRVLESGQFSRVGSNQTRTTDARIIAATNKDLGREVQAGRFREDLYYRLSTVRISLPPLRERKEDILPLFESFVFQSAQKYNSSRRTLDASARDLVRRYAWPGNVRELRNVAEQTVVLLRGESVSAADLQPFLRGVTAGTGTELMPIARTGEADETRERELIYRALLELRHEMRDVKEEMSKLVELIRGGFAARPSIEPNTLAGSNFVVVRKPEEDEEDYASYIEDVIYEIENGDEGEDEADDSALPDFMTNTQALPTLEDAEHELITRALKQFEGNRRQAAKALGISERTLYRKLKEIDEEL